MQSREPSPSNNTQQYCWISDMSGNTVGRVMNEIKQAVSQFALQLDEVTDVSGETQLPAFAPYKDASGIKEHILFCNILG